MAHIFQKTLQSSVQITKSCMKLPYLFRSFTTGKILASNYEGDGKTTVTILNREYKHLILIDAFSDSGFRLNNGIFTVGSLAVFPKTVLQWNVNNIAEITPESLSLFCLLEPRLDILVIGSGDKRILPSKHVLEYLKSRKIPVEILATDHACATFNFLNVEGRCVAGAFIPPSHIVPYEEERKLLHQTEAMVDYSEKTTTGKIEG